MMAQVAAWLQTTPAAADLTIREMKTPPTPAKVRHVGGVLSFWRRGRQRRHQKQPELLISTCRLAHIY
jgi:hypothetical protein